MLKELLCRIHEAAVNSLHSSQQFPPIKQPKSPSVASPVFASAFAWVTIVRLWCIKSSSKPCPISDVNRLRNPASEIICRSIGHICARHAGEANLRKHACFTYLFLSKACVAGSNRVAAANFLVNISRNRCVFWSRRFLRAASSVSPLVFRCDSGRNYNAATPPEDQWEHRTHGTDRRKHTTSHSDAKCEDKKCLATSTVCVTLRNKV